MSTTSQPKAGRQDAVTIEAKSLEQAVVKAAGVLGVNQDEVEYEIVKEETSKGLFSFFKSPVVAIKARVKAKKAATSSMASPSSSSQARSSQVRSSSAREQREAAPIDVEAAKAAARRAIANCSDESTDDAAAAAKIESLSQDKLEALCEELRAFCVGICTYIAGEPVEVVSRIEEGRLVLDVQSDYIAQQIGKNSKLAEAMEHILRKKPRHLRQELPFRIFVDVSGMRKKREEDLIQMAFDLSAKVHENKRPIVLNYKSSYDRKIIHMALDKDARVYTKSIGSGPNRKLMILPNRDNQTPYDMLDAETIE